MKILRLLRISLLCFLMALTKAQVQTNETAPRQNSFLDWLNSIFLPSVPAPGNNPQNCPACTCGTPNTVKRIVGGHEAKVNQYPWMAMMKIKTQFICGATLYSEWYAISAAHCLSKLPQNLMNYISITLLVHELKNSKAQSPIVRKIVKVLNHPRFNQRTLDNDINLLKFEKKVEMSNILRPVCLPMAGKSYDNEVGIVTGWGYTMEDGQSPSKLQEVRLPIISLAKCRQMKYNRYEITDNMLCASSSGKDACTGDSGGPFTVENSNLNTYHLVGVVSWGRGCARPGYPGVFTRVTKYLSWIENNSRDSCKCNQPAKKLEAFVFDEEE